MQAALITAYKDMPQLTRLVKTLVPTMRVFVHIDRKSDLDPEEIRACGATVLKKYKIGWGSYYHLRAVLDLMRLAMADGSVDYVHVVSGQDFPVQSPAWFEKTFGGSKMINSLVRDNSDSAFDHDWYRYLHVATLLDLNQQNGKVRRIDKFFVSLQKALHIARKSIGGYPIVYKSLIYVSLPRDAAEYVISRFDSNLRLRFDLRTSLIPEELFFMTVLKNSPFADRISGKDYRYGDWNNRNGGYPAVLDETDFDRIYGTNAEYAFARKVDSKISAALIERIERKVGL